MSKEKINQKHASELFSLVINEKSELKSSHYFIEDRHINCTVDGYVLSCGAVTARKIYDNEEYTVDEAFYDAYQCMGLHHFVDSIDCSIYDSPFCFTDKFETEVRINDEALRAIFYSHAEDARFALAERCIEAAELGEIPVIDRDVVRLCREAMMLGC